MGGYKIDRFNGTVRSVLKDSLWVCGLHAAVFAASDALTVGSLLAYEAAASFEPFIFVANFLYAADIVVDVTAPAVVLSAAYPFVKNILDDFNNNSTKSSAFLALLAGGLIAAADYSLYSNASDSCHFNPSLSGIHSTMDKDLRIYGVYTEIGNCLEEKGIQAKGIEGLIGDIKASVSDAKEEKKLVDYRNDAYFIPEDSTVNVKENTVVNVLPQYNTDHSQACFTGKVIALSDPEVVGLESLGAKPELTHHARAVFKGTLKPKAAYVIRYDENGAGQARTMGVVIDPQGRAVPESCPVR